MHRQNAVRLELAKIERHGLACEQVNGNGGAEESIDKNEIVALIVSISEPQSRVSLYNVRALSAFRDIGEEPWIAGDPDHVRIDLVISDCILGIGTARHRAG